MIGVSGAADWRDLRLSELRRRYIAVLTQQWNHTAQLQATLIAVMGGKQVSPIELHPFKSNARPSAEADDRALDSYIDFHQRKFHRENQ